MMTGSKDHAPEGSFYPVHMVYLQRQLLGPTYSISRSWYLPQVSRLAVLQDPLFRSC